MINSLLGNWRPRGNANYNTNRYISKQKIIFLKFVWNFPILELSDQFINYWGIQLFNKLPERNTEIQTTDVTDDNESAHICGSLLPTFLKIKADQLVTKGFLYHSLYAKLQKQARQIVMICHIRSTVLTINHTALPSYFMHYMDVVNTRATL